MVLIDGRCVKREWHRNQLFLRGGDAHRELHAAEPVFSYIAANDRQGDGRVT